MPLKYVEDGKTRDLTVHASNCLIDLGWNAITKKYAFDPIFKTSSINPNCLILNNNSI
ncbi:hypothetical protein GCM10011356_20810 [Kangiella profundi]|nr:hypothetical protein GCM10011356_20810 [Kangiella profundi]